MPINNDFRARVEDIISALMTDCVVSVSHELEVYLKKWLVVKRCCYKTIINGVNTAKFNTLPKNKKERFLQKALSRKSGISTDNDRGKSRS